ncbi:MAG: tRNA lysidine(34) synthetase TilS [Pseudomonadota bacterium]
MFDVLSDVEAVLLAVSGGPDSTALMVLAAGYWSRQGRDPSRLQVATVDHGLRAESADEARQVADIAARYGLQHHALVWGERPHTALQERARAARYTMLGVLARQLWPDLSAAVATGHTRDDQVEPLLMRLSRGTGLDGLAGIAPARFLDPFHETRLVRPLLPVSKAQLMATLQQTGVAWVVDPSNADPTFERVRIRAALAAACEAGDDLERIAQTAERLRVASLAIDAACCQLATTAQLSLNTGAFAAFDLAAVRQAPVAVQVRFLTKLLAAFGGQDDPPRLSRIERLVKQLDASTFRAATTAGCLVRRHGTWTYLMREPDRRPFPRVVLQPGDCARWDNRFVVGLADDAAGEVQVVAVPQLTEIQGSSDELHRRGWQDAMSTLPAFMTDQMVVVVPHLDPQSADRAGCQVRFRRVGLEDTAM